jgi:MoxR-like ATPase
VHIEARLAQLDEVLARARSGLAGQQAHAQALARRLQGRLWLPPALAAQLRAGAELGVERLWGLVQRLEATREGFAALPVDPAAAPAAAPRPLAIDA